MLRENSSIASVKQISGKSRITLIRTVDFVRVHIYLHIGERNFKEEQQGKALADYGKLLISTLDESLETKFGRWFTKRQLERIRKCYRPFPIAFALCSQFKKKSFSAIVPLAIIAILMLQMGCTRQESVDIDINANISNQIPVNTANTRTDAIWNEKVAKDAVLQRKADSLLNLFDKMPQVPVFTKDEPILKVGTNTEKALAYTVCEVNDKPSVFIKLQFYRKANQKQLTNILKHELTHAWFCRQGIQVAHDEIFRKKFKSIGGFGN